MILAFWKSLPPPPVPLHPGTGVMEIERAGRFGLVSEDGTVLVPSKYGWVSDGNDSGRFQIQEWHPEDEGKHGLLDDRGRIVVPLV
jgi:hypothetical protein